MRIASVLHDASIDKDGAPLLATVAIERDGALYGVAALAEALGSTCASHDAGARGRRYAMVSDDSDFQHAVISLRGESFRELDERVRAGERPSSARLLPGTFTWLPPCATERASLFLPSGEDARGPSRGPSFRLGFARALLGHEATVPVLSDEGHVAIACAVAAVLGDDLFRATEREAHDAIFGYTLLLAYEDGLAAQLGPSLVTRDECGPVASLRAQVRLDGQALSVCEVGDRPFSAAETIAWISHHVPLRAGDVIGAARIDASDLRHRVAFGTRVELAVERLGKLAGKPTQGPPMRPWRR